MVVINIHPSFNNSLFYTSQWIKQIANEPTSDINFIVLLMKKQFNDFIHSNHLSIIDLWYSISGKNNNLSKVEE